MEVTSPYRWPLAIFGFLLAGILYLICCAYSARKAISERRAIIGRNQERRNQRFLKQMGVQTENTLTQSSLNTTFPSTFKVTHENGKGACHNYPATNARKVNLEDLDSIINEAVSAAEFTNDSSDTSRPLRNEPLAEKSRIISGDACPRVFYLRARTPEKKDLGTTSNWVADRLNNASNFATAQRQLQFGLKRAPLAKQNSGFSSMDEDSSASTL